MGVGAGYLEGSKPIQAVKAHSCLNRSQRALAPVGRTLTLTTLEILSLLMSGIVPLVSKVPQMRVSCGGWDLGGPFNGPLSLWKVSCHMGFTLLRPMWPPHIPNARGTSKTYGEPGLLQALGPQTNRTLVLPFRRDSWERPTHAVTSP